MIASNKLKITIASAFLLLLAVIGWLVVTFVKEYKVTQAVAQYALVPAAKVAVTNVAGQRSAIVKLQLGKGQLLQDEQVAKILPIVTAYTKVAPQFISIVDYEGKVLYPNQAIQARLQLLIKAVELLTPLFGHDNFKVTVNGDGKKTNMIIAINDYGYRDYLGRRHVVQRSQTEIAVIENIVRTTLDHDGDLINISVLRSGFSNNSSFNIALWVVLGIIGGVVFIILNKVHNGEQLAVDNKPAVDLSYINNLAHSDPKRTAQILSKWIEAQNNG